MRLFKSIKPTNQSVHHMEQVVEQCEVLADLISRVVPCSRQRDIVFMKLEEVAMWSNKAIVHNQVVCYSCEATTIGKCKIHP